jgi:hypothetical protein
MARFIYKYIQKAFFYSLANGKTADIVFDILRIINRKLLTTCRPSMGENDCPVL